MKHLIIQNTVYHTDNLIKNNTLEGIVLSDTSIEVFYNDEVKNFVIPYKDIREMKLVITCEQGFRYDFINKFTLQIVYEIDSKEHKLSLINAKTNGLLDRIFGIICFSRYINNFSYVFTKAIKGSMALDKAIKSYIHNNYKHTFYSFGYTKWAIPVLISTVILLFMALFLIGYLIAIGVI